MMNKKNLRATIKSTWCILMRCLFFTSCFASFIAKAGLILIGSDTGAMQNEDRNNLTLNLKNLKKFSAVLY